MWLLNIDFTWYIQFNLLLFSYEISEEKFLEKQHLIWKQSFNNKYTKSYYLCQWNLYTNKQYSYVYALQKAKCKNKTGNSLKRDSKLVRFYFPIIGVCKYWQNILYNNVLSKRSLKNILTFLLALYPVSPSNKIMKANTLTMKCNLNEHRSDAGRFWMAFISISE